MKRKNKIFKALLFAIAAILAIGITASASEADVFTKEEMVCGSSDKLCGRSKIEKENSIITVTYSEKALMTADEPDYTEGAPAPTENRSESEIRNDSEGSEGSADNVFSQMYDYFTYYAGDIFGALAFLVSLVLSFLYKNKLIPTISKSSDKMEKELRKLSDSTAKNLEEVYKKSEESKCATLSLAASFEEMTASLDKALKNMEGYDRLTSQRDEIRMIISSQIDMLYDIFMSSSIPQYQKENVGNRIMEMKEKLAKND